MYEDDEDRINTAEPLAENNLSAAAEAFHGPSLATRQSPTRYACPPPNSSPPSIPQPPHRAWLAIARDPAAGDEVRRCAAEQLATLTSNA